LGFAQKRRVAGSSQLPREPLLHVSYSSKTVLFFLLPANNPPLNISFFFPTVGFLDLSFTLSDVFLFLVLWCLLPPSKFRFSLSLLKPSGNSLEPGPAGSFHVGSKVTARVIFYKWFFLMFVSLSSQADCSSPPKLYVWVFSFCFPNDFEKVKYPRYFFLWPFLDTQPLFGTFARNLCIPFFFQPARVFFFLCRHPNPPVGIPPPPFGNLHFHFTLFV